MKRYSFILILTLAFSLIATANNDNKTRKASITNYTEVLGKIEYPQVCREKAIEGTVVVTMKINKSGDIQSYEFVEFPCSDLKDAVEKALPELNFLPALTDGKAVNSKITIPVKFALEN